MSERKLRHGSSCFAQGGKICYRAKLTMQFEGCAWRRAQHRISTTTWACRRSRSAPRNSCASAPSRLIDHPHIFIDMGDDKEAVCPYCSTLYKYNAKLGRDGIEAGERLVDGRSGLKLAALARFRRPARLSRAVFVDHALIELCSAPAGRRHSRRAPPGDEIAMSGSGTMLPQTDIVTLRLSSLISDGRHGTVARP